MKRFCTALLVGAMVLPMSLLVGCKNSASERSGINRNLLNAKLILKDMKESFESGQITKDSSGVQGGGGRPDGRMNILVLQIQDKIRVTIAKRENDVAKRDKAEAKRKECEQTLVQQIIPKYQEAMKSKKPEDAKALVPLMDQLDKQLDELNKIIGA